MVDNPKGFECIYCMHTYVDLSNENPLKCFLGKKSIEVSLLQNTTYKESISMQTLGRGKYYIYVVM